MKASSRAPLLRRRRGFTLIEILVVVVIVGVLAAIAIPAFIKTKRSSTVGRLANDLKKYAEAYMHYNMSVGTWPADVNRAIVPAGMQGYFNADSWELTTPIGGNWDYDAGQFGVTAAVSINGHSADAAMVASLDELVDDGDATSGRMRSPQSNYILFVLED